MTEEELSILIDKILSENQKKVRELDALTKKTIGHLLGQIFRENPRVSPTITNEILKRKLDEP